MPRASAVTAGANFFFAGNRQAREGDLFFFRNVFCSPCQNAWNWCHLKSMSGDSSAEQSPFFLCFLLHSFEFNTGDDFIIKRMTMSPLSIQAQLISFLLQSVPGGPGRKENPRARPRETSKRKKSSNEDDDVGGYDDFVRVGKACSCSRTCV